MNSLDRLDWSLIGALLAVAEAGSLSAAARRLGLSQPTLGRQVQAAEAALGVAVFRRHARGLELTETGAALMEPAREMRAAAAKLMLAAAGQETRLSGTVRITASVVISQRVLPALLTRLRREEPGIEIELHPTDQSDNLLYGEADIALRMYRPEQLDVITRHLGDIPLGLFAAQSYLDRRGWPATEAELFRHDWVGLDRDDLMIRGLRDLGYRLERGFFGLRCDDQAVYWRLVEEGGGIGVCQRHLGRQAAGLVELFPGFRLPVLPLWLTAHQALRQSPRIRRVWDFLAARLPAAVGLGPLDPPAAKG